MVHNLTSKDKRRLTALVCSQRWCSMRAILIILALMISTWGRSDDMILTNTPEIVLALEYLKGTSKFNEDIVQLYPGAPNEEVRIKANSILNNVIARLISHSDKGFSEDQFWAVLEAAAKEYSLMDSEEMDRAMVYFEQLMDTYGIESSGGRLNEWRYGFQP